MGLIHGTAPLDAAKTADYVLGRLCAFRLLLFVPADSTPRLDSADNGIRRWRSDLEWSYDQDTDTGRGQQDACSSAVGASKPPTTHVTKLCLGYRLPPGLEAPGARILSSTSAKGTGVACWLAEHNRQHLGLFFSLLFDTYMRPSEGLALRGFQLLPPIKEIAGAGEKWSLLIRASWGSLAK